MRSTSGAPPAATLIAFPIPFWTAWLHISMHLANSPRPRGCRKMEGSFHDWRLRVGNYRIIYEIDDDARRVIVLHIKHRREAYR